MRASRSGLRGEATAGRSDDRGSCTLDAGEDRVQAAGGSKPADVVDSVIFGL